MKTRRCVTLFWVVVLLAVAPLRGQDIGGFELIPVVGHTAGAGQPPTYWVSDVTIHNLMSERLTVGMAYFPFDMDNEWDETYPVSVQLEARETMLLGDVLATYFGITGNAKGALLLSCDKSVFPENPGDSVMMVTSRTYNVGSPEGTYGQTVPPATMLWNGSATPSYITGARNDNRYRSNLGLFNISADRVTVHYRLLGPDGSVLTSGSSEIPKASGMQWSFSQLGIGTIQGAITVELWLDPVDVTPDPCSGVMPNYFTAYVSKADGNPDGTGDAEFLVAVPTEFPPVGFACPGEGGAPRIVRR